MNFPLPGTLRVIQYFNAWRDNADKTSAYPIFEADDYLQNFDQRSPDLNFVMIDSFSAEYAHQDLKKIFDVVKHDKTAVICLSSTNKNAVQSIRRMFVELHASEILNPVVLITDSSDNNMDESLIHYAVETGALLLDGFGDGICLGHHFGNSARNSDFALINSIGFGILQATRTRISKTEYISCPSCGRTLFDLQETTAKIRAVTNHLKGCEDCNHGLHCKWSRRNGRC